MAEKYSGVAFDYAEYVKEGEEIGVEITLKVDGEKVKTRYVGEPGLRELRMLAAVYKSFADSLVLYNDIIKNK